VTLSLRFDVKIIIKLHVKHLLAYRILKFNAKTVQGSKFKVQNLNTKYQDARAKIQIPDK